MLALGAIDERLRGQSNAEVLADAASHHAYLRALWWYSGQTIGLVVIGADGHALVESERPATPRNIDVSDREYFRWHRDHPGAEPHVSGAVRSRADGEAVFFVSLRRSATDGAFVGVLVDGVRQSTFIDYWDHAVPDRDAAISLIREDGSILARRPAVDPEERPRLAPGSLLVRAIGAGAERVVLRGTSMVDGIERLVAIRRLGHFPVYIGHGVPRAAALAPGTTASSSMAASPWRWRRRSPSLALLARRQARELHDLNASLERRVAERTAEIQAGEARLRLLAREVDHRSKNALAVVQATLRLTPKVDAAAYAAAVEGRVSALARAQTLLAEDRWRGASLHALLRAELAPFVAPDGDTAGPRAELDGPPVLLPPALVQPLAMTVHELATNAVKHGALSALGGRVRVSWRLADTVAEAGAEAGDRLVGDRLVGDRLAGARLALRWAETGGPALAGPPARRGFGSRVMESVVRGQLGGSLACSWEAPGLTSRHRSATRPRGDECCNGRGCRCSMNRRAPAPWTPAPYAGQVGYDPEPERAWCAASYRGPCCCGGPGCYGGLSRARHGVVIAASPAARYRPCTWKPWPAPRSTPCSRAACAAASPSASARACPAESCSRSSPNARSAAASAPSGGWSPCCSGRCSACRSRRCCCPCRAMPSRASRSSTTASPPG